MAAEAAAAAAAAAAAPGSSLSLSLSPSACPSQQWILGDRLARTGNVSVGNAETFYRGGRGRLAQTSALLRLHVFSPRGQKRGKIGRGRGGLSDVFQEKEKKNPPFLQKNKLGKFGMHAASSDQIFLGWRWCWMDVKLNFAGRRDLPPAGQTKSPYSAGC